MARRRNLSPPDELLRASHNLLFHRDEAKRAADVQKKARDLLHGWLTARDANGKLVNGRTDENGHRYYDFDEPLSINDKTYAGIQAQRKVSSYIDTDAAEALLKSKGGSAYDVVFKRVVIREFDEEALFALQQKGVISEAELDDLVVSDESFSIVPVKA